MKDIIIHILDENELPFWKVDGVEVTIQGYENFNNTDKQFLEDLTKWLKGVEDERQQIK